MGKHADAVKAAPPVIPTDAAHTPIGVAPNYTVTVPNPSQAPGFTGPASPGQMLTVKPRYFSGAQNTEVAGLSPEDRAQLQVQMKQLGLIGKEQAITLGVWDSTSSNAFQQILAWANTTGSDWRGALADMQASATSFDQTAAVKQTSKASNPLDFAAAGDTIGRSVIGRELNDAESKKFIGQAQGQEAPYLTSDATTSAPGQAGFTDWAKDQIREIDPLKADARRKLRVAAAIQNMLIGNVQNPAVPQEL
jgi:hypothetical protein